MKASVLSAATLAALLALAGCLETMPHPERPHPVRPPRPEKPMACTREYAPVCAVKGRHKRQTFSNACMARADGFRIVSQRACER